MATRLILRIVSGPFGDASRLTVSQARVQGGQSLTVGRNRLSADLGIRQDPRMSGKHFRVALEGDVCRLYDLQSRNGTSLNGKPVKEAILSDGDEIRAGRTVFQVVIHGGANLSSTAIEFGAISAADLQQFDEEESGKRQAAERKHAVVEDEPREADAGGVQEGGEAEVGAQPDVAGVFEQVRAKLRRRLT